MGSSIRDMKLKRKIPSLVDLCIQTTIDNLRYLGDVGETDIELMKDILPHCTADQLMRIEKSTEGRDLSSVTNKLWRRFFQQKFGMETFHSLAENLKRNKVVFTWRMLYEAQLEDLELVQKENAEKLKQKYREENLKKQSRQVPIVSKVPPSSNKRNFCFGGGGGGGWNSSSNKFPNAKGNLMKKARMEFLNSHEVKAQSVMKRIALKSSQSAPRPVKPTSFPGMPRLQVLIVPSHIEDLRCHLCIYCIPLMVSLAGLQKTISIFTSLRRKLSVVMWSGSSHIYAVNVFLLTCVSPVEFCQYERKNCLLLNLSFSSAHGLGPMNTVPS